MNNTSHSAELLDRLPPADLDAERAVLGTMILHPSRCNDIALRLRAEDFYREAHQKLFRAIIAVYDKKGTVDGILLRAWLITQAELEAIGGVAYVGEISQKVPSVYSLDHYANIVSAKAALRRVLLAGVEMIRGAHEPGAIAEELINRADELLDEAAAGGQRTATISAADALVKTLDQIDQAEGRGRGLSTGLADLDRYQGGLFPAELVVLAARPRMGKSVLAGQIATHFATHGRHVLFVSLEMSETDLMGRALCSRAGVDSSLLRTGGLVENDKKALVTAANELAEMKLELAVPTDSLTVADVRRLAHQQKRKAGLGLLVIDYLGQLTADNERDPRHEQVAKMSRALKGLARELDVPLLCVCQLNREVEKAKGDHRPRLGHLRESGAIEQDADVVAFLHREEEYSHDPEHVGKAELIVAKNRNGPAKTYALRWDAATTTFTTPAPSYWEPTDSYENVVKRSEQQTDLDF